MTPITNETRRQIINNEMQAWMNTQEVLIIRHRVNKRLGNAEQMKVVEKELENCEAALDELTKMLDEDK